MKIAMQEEQNPGFLSVQETSDVYIEGHPHDAGLFTYVYGSQLPALARAVKL